jgi:large-conductance mechanosensitive channel
MVFDILKVGGIVKEFTDFIYEQKILAFFIGTFAGIASANFITSFKKNVLDYILTKIFHLNELNSLFFLTSIIEYMMMLFALYIIIKLVKPYFDKRDAEKKAETDLQQNELLTTLNNINNKLDGSTSATTSSSTTQ